MIVSIFLMAIAVVLSPKIYGNAHPNDHLIESTVEYHDDEMTIWDQLRHRVEMQPFNLVATGIFFLAICHTFMAHQFTKLSHHLKEKHRNKIASYVAKRQQASNPFDEDLEEDVSFSAEITHFLGEVEIIFMIWVIPLAFAMTFYFDWETTLHYIDIRNYDEPVFIVVIMTLAATRPILRFAEQSLASIARVGGGTAAAWWVTLLTVGPILGSFITEPAAMTICSLILGSQFFRHGPSARFKYATLGLLFVNISVGGTLTHFAAPPVLMVATPWNWDTHYMLTHFGWKAVVGILISTSAYYFLFRSEFAALEDKRVRYLTKENRKQSDRPIPAWVTIIHLFLLIWTVVNSHHPAVFIGTFILFLGFYQATAPHQSYMTLKSPILVGSFLAGLVLHGGLQAWWLAPVLGGVSESFLMKLAIVLTAFNDNAAVTYLTTLIPNLGPDLKYAVVSGAVIGGGLTVIANAPNPAGQSLLKKYFEDGISPVGLFLAALSPTVIQFLCFALTS